MFWFYPTLQSERGEILNSLPKITGKLIKPNAIRVLFGMAAPKFGLSSLEVSFVAFATLIAYALYC